MAEPARGREQEGPETIWSTRGCALSHLGRHRHLPPPGYAAQGHAADAVSLARSAPSPRQGDAPRSRVPEHRRRIALGLVGGAHAGQSPRCGLGMGIVVIGGAVHVFVWPTPQYYRS
jgi:hypothetical protein